eukprot:281836-Amphidinium_carterae.1
MHWVQGERADQDMQKMQSQRASVALVHAAHLLWAKKVSLEHTATITSACKLSCTDSKRLLRNI